MRQMENALLVAPGCLALCVFIILCAILLARY
jgi:hypothetical protein